MSLCRRAPRPRWRTPHILALRLLISFSLQGAKAAMVHASSGALDSVPLLVVHGEEDVLVNPSGSTALIAALKSHTDVHLLTYPGMRHEVLFEITGGPGRAAGGTGAVSAAAAAAGSGGSAAVGGAAVLSDITRWIKEKLTS